MPSCFIRCLLVVFSKPAFEREGKGNLRQGRNTFLSRLKLPFPSLSNATQASIYPAT